MKTMILTLALVALGAPAYGAGECNVKMQNAASFELAQTAGVAVQNVKIIRFESGPWTEAVGNNVGSGLVAVNVYSRDTVYYNVSAQQIGTSADCKITGLTEHDPMEIHPRLKQAEKYKRLIGDAAYMSEGDEYFYTYVSRKSVDATYSTESLQEALGTSEPVDVWTHEETVSFLDDYANDNPYSSAEGYRFKRLKEEMLKDFTEIHVIKTGGEDSGARDLYIVGRDASGRLVGLKTISVET